MNEISLVVLTAAGVVLLFATSAFFSASETAIMAVNRLRLRDLSGKGDRRALRVESLLKDPNQLLSGILLGNNFANIMLASLATAVAIPVWGDMAPLYVSPILTVMLLVFAEIVPKTIAANRSLAVSRLCVTPLSLFLRVARPLVWAASGIARVFVAMVTRSSSNPGGSPGTISERDMVTLANVGHEQGTIETTTREMIHGVMDFSNLVVRDVMIPRHNLVSMPMSGGLDGFRTMVRETGHTRIPVWKENEEDVAGVLHAKDLVVGGGAPQVLEELLHPAEFVPESAPLNQVLRRLQDTSTQMLFVVDEYGGLEGVVTIRDLIEELVGDIEDEHDQDAGRRVNILKSGCVIADASVTLRYLARKTGIEFDESSASTLGGLLLSCGPKSLAEGAEITLDSIRFTVLSTKGRFLRKIRIDPETPLTTRDPGPNSS